MGAFLMFYAPFLILILSIGIAFFIASNDDSVNAIEE